MWKKRIVLNIFSENKKSSSKSQTYIYFIFYPHFSGGVGLCSIFYSPQPATTTTARPDDNTVIPYIRTIKILSVGGGQQRSVFFIIKSDFARPWLEYRTGI